MRARGVNCQKIPYCIRNYLFIHVAAQYVLQKLLTQEEVKDTVLLEAAEDGPLKYLTDNNWDSKKAVEALINGKYMNGMIKLRGCERKALENHSAFASDVSQ